AVAPASPGRQRHHRHRFRPQAVRSSHDCIVREDAARAGFRTADRTHSQGGVIFILSLRISSEATERPTSLPAQVRTRIVGVLRAVPIRWRILSIALLNSAVVVVLAALIWNGSKVLGSAWEDVRQVRESDKILALLESETSRLQNLIHRYINQP